WVVEIAEQPRPRRAGEHACRLPVLRCPHLVVDAIDAERALFHRPRYRIELARAVRARPCAQVAAHALVLVDEHDAVGAPVRRPGGTYGDAVGVGAVHAGQRKIDRLGVRIVADLVVAHAVEPYAGGLGAEWLIVGKRAV